MSLTLIVRCRPMIAKRISKDQLILPDSIIAAFPETKYFDVVAGKGSIVLTPAKLDPVWRQIEELGITEEDIADAVMWARSDNTHSA